MIRLRQRVILVTSYMAVYLTLLNCSYDDGNNDNYLLRYYHYHILQIWK